MPKPKVSKNPNANWRNDDIQFPRLIAELKMAGAFTPQVVRDLTESMDLGEGRVWEIIGRAEAVWDGCKDRA